MDIGSHILSRIPGDRPVSYKDIPRLLGKNRIIPADFADGSLTKMAGYRNRMVRFYGEITEKEIYHLLQDELEGLYTFLKHLHKLIENPVTFDLSIS